MRVIQLAIVILGIIFAGPTSSCPYERFSDYLTGLPNGVLVSFDDGNVIFDDSGNSRQEFLMERSTILGLTKDGQLWTFRSEDKQTILSSHTSNGSIIKEYEFDGSRPAYIQGDQLFVARNDNSLKLQIDIFNPQTETLEYFSTVTTSSRADRWAVGSNLICAVSVNVSDTVSVVTCFSQDGTQLWTSEYYGVVEMFGHIQIDSQNNIYLIGSLVDNRSPAVLQFDHDGNLKKEIASKNGIYGFAISDRGSFFVADIDDVVHRYDSNGKLQESWDASPLLENETWIERRNKERTANSVSEYSNTDDLIVAALHGKSEQRIKASNWLFSRGSEIIPYIIKNCISENWASEELLDRALEEMPQETLSEIVRRFPKANEVEKEAVASRLIDAGRTDVSGLLEFVENKIENSEDYYRFNYEILLVKMGKGRKILEENWRRLQNAEMEVENLTFMLSNNLSDSSDILEPSLLNSYDPWNTTARKLMSDALTWNIYDKNSLKPSDITKFEKWIDTGSPDLIPIATVGLLKGGKLQKLNDAIQFAKEDLSLAPAVLKFSSDAIIKHPELKSGFGSQIYELLKKLLFSETDDIQKYFGQDVLKELMQFSEFRDMAVSDALQSFAAKTSNTEFIISNYLGPELVSREVVSAFLATPISSNEKYWKYVDLIATRYVLDPFVKEQIRRLMLSQVNSNSPYASDALKILAKVGESSDSVIISNLVRHGSNPCEACTFHEGLKTLGHIGVSDQSASNVLPYLEIEPVIAAAALSRAAFPQALEILLDEAGKTSGYHPIELTGSMFAPYGKEAEDGLLAQLETVNDRGRQKILLLLAEMGSKAGHDIVRKQFDDALTEEQFPSDGSIAALMIYGQDPWSELLEHLAETGDTCNEYLFRSFPSRLRIQAATRIAQLMLNENDADRFKVLRCWLYKMDQDEEIEYLLEWVHLNHSNPKMRELMFSY